jgi:hypothetical protein
MNKNFIKELNASTTYLEFRILTYLECEEKMKKITQIINFLKQNNFLINLSIVYYNQLRAENIPEQKNVPSLSIDMRDDKFRFKYFDGAKTYWTYHLDDLFDVLISGREEFSLLVDKYQPITDLLFRIKNENKDVKFIRYRYYPKSDIDIEYEIHFFEQAKDTNVADLTMKEVFRQIDDLKLEDLKMDLIYTFEEKCLPCQRAKEKAQNERKNMEG